MRKIILSATFIFLSVICNAQLFHGELKLGVAGSQVSGDELSGFDKAGLLIGGGVRAKIKDKVSLGFNILYLQKGSRSPNNLSNGDTSYYRLRLNYLELPISIRFNLGKKLYVEAGPSFGYLVGSAEEDQDGNIPYRKPFFKYDVSFAGSFGYPFGTGWDLQAGFWQSLLPVREHDGGATYHLNRGQYNSVISISILRTMHPVSNKE